MKIVSFTFEGKNRIGIITDGNKVVDIQKAYEELLISEGIARAKELAEALIPHNTVDLIANGDRSLSAINEAIAFIHEQTDSPAIYDMEQIQLGAPVQKPGKIICVGHNYREHILEMKREIPTHPVIFAKFHNAVNGPFDPVELPPYTEKLDYEAEFAFVIGKQAKQISKEDALDYIFGYTVVNDVSARDLQKRTLQWFQGKNLDGSLPMGPWLVTKDEIPDPDSLDITCFVNGELRQHSNTRSFVFDIPTLVSFISGIMTLEPGDVICTGTPGGVGDGMDPKVYLKDGDIVEVKVDKIGQIANKIKEVSKELVQ